VYGLYSLILILLLIFYAPVYFIRMKLGRKERIYLRERLGIRLPTVLPGEPAIWVHAVSVGEVLSLRRLVSEIKRKHPSWPVYFSTLTNTGYRIARQKLPEADAIFLVPLDFGWAVRRFFSTLRPHLFILAESEFWPHLLRQAGRTCQSVLLINGRISQRSFRKYYRLRVLAKRMLSQIDHFLVQTDNDRRRLEKIGIKSERVEVAGNLKADIQLPMVNPEQIDELRRKIGVSQGKRLIVAGSTHKGEEEKILRALSEARRSRQDLAVVIAPRHPERSSEVERIGTDLSLNVVRRTQAKPGRPWDVLILDTIGELARFYALADLAFIGGSLVPHGGQNLLEPAYYGRPLIFGPYMDNFAPLAEEFTRSGAARVVRNQSDLQEVFLMKDRAALEDMGTKARELLSSLQGATDRTIQVIESLLAGSGDKAEYMK
jgi:3-deoxy-D-manno-octulosonic-acid transferase